MNFSDLLSKMKAIDEGQPISECGDMMAALQGGQDEGNVSISINMNGQGKEGVRDLMSVLRDIENSPASDADDILVGEPGDSHEEPVMGDIVSDMEEDQFANSAPNASGSTVHGIDAVTGTGDDMHSKGDIKRPKVNGGENPMQESIAARLATMYSEMKGGAIEPVRNANVQQSAQQVAPQANRPGLAPNGDPKLWDIQYALRKQGYKIATDGLNGPQTEKIARTAGLVHDTTQDVANPGAASVGAQIGHAIGSGVGWIETAWRNLKQGFSAGQQGLEEEGESDPLANREKYAKQHSQGQVYKKGYPGDKVGMSKSYAYDIKRTGPKGPLPKESINESTDIIALSKMING